MNGGVQKREAQQADRCRGKGAALAWGGVWLCVVSIWLRELMVGIGGQLSSGISELLPVEWTE